MSFTTRTACFYDDLYLSISYPRWRRSMTGDSGGMLDIVKLANPPHEPLTFFIQA